MTGLIGLDDLDVGAWDALGGNAFHAPGFLRAARGLSGSAGVRLLVVDGPDLVLPVHTVDRFRKVPVRALSTWTHDYCYLGDPLVRPGQEQRAWTQALSFLRSERPASWLHLPRLSASGPGYDGLLAALRELDMPFTPIGAHVRASVARRPSFTYFDETISGVHRKGYRRLRRVLARSLGEVRTVESSDVEPFLALERSGWKAGTDMTSDPGAADLARALVSSGAATVLSLYAGDRVVASQLQLLRGTTSSCFKTAYDESLRQHSPGALLELDVVQHFHDDPRFDLLDSCASPGHPLVDRLFPDRLPITTLLIGLSPRGRAAARLTPSLAQGWSRLSRRPMEVP